MAIGIAVGLALSLAFDNWAFLAIGVAVGLLLFSAPRFRQGS